MTNREPRVAAFLWSLEQALAAAALEPDAKAAIGRIWTALAVSGAAGDIAPQRLPVCRHLDEALGLARARSPALAALADAFAALEPSLSWKPRASGGPNSSPNWPAGHANATVVGPGGLEDRPDVLIGASLLAPDVRYPDHDHPPEEVYILLSPGRFRHGVSDWFEPGVGGTLYNEPGIRHAMASDAAPLLALWCLWLGECDGRRSGPA